MTLAALGLVLAGCASMDRIDPSDLNRGVLILGLDRAPELDTTPFVADVRAVGVSGQIEIHDPGSRRRAFAKLPPKRLFRSQPGSLFAFTLEPGEYVLARIGIGLDAASPETNRLIGRDPLDGLFGLGLAVLVKEAQEASEGRPIVFVDGKVAAANAPRFVVRPGEVLYVGDILIGAEYRDTPAASAPTPDEKNRYGGLSYRYTRLFAEIVANEPAARRFADTLGLARRPFRSQPIRLSAAARTMFPSDATPPKDATEVRIARAKPELPRAAPPLLQQPAPASVPPPTDVRRLMERFLAGEISKEEYERERARPAAGS